MKSNRYQIPLVFLLILCLSGLGLASPLAPCNCEKPKFPAVGANPHQGADCCARPVNPAPSSCPCGENCTPSLQELSMDSIVFFSSINPVSSLESGHFLVFPFGSFSPEPVISGLGSPNHSPPSGPVYLQTRSLRC